VREKDIQIKGKFSGNDLPLFIVPSSTSESAPKCERFKVPETKERER
jgi:hypothetical protein